MRSLLGVLLAVSSVANAHPDLTPDTLAAWDKYVSAANSNLYSPPSPQQRQRLEQGDVIVSEIKSDAQKIPDAAIHDWTGTLFIPGVSLDDVLNVVWNYEKYPKWFGPTIAEAHLLGRNADEDRFSILYVRTVLFVTVAMEMEYVAHHTHVDATHLSSVAQSTHIYELHNYGKPNQSKSPADDGSGYIWRVHSISKYEQRDNGVYIEQENIVLSQRIPVAYRWLVEPAIKRLAKNLLEGSLKQTREAVRSETSH